MKSVPDTWHDDSRKGLLRHLRMAGVSERVVHTMKQVQRDRFVPPEFKKYAWNDESLPIGNGQTISQPSLVGRMIDQLNPQPKHHILDVGTGSGYQASILSLLVESVVSVERIPALCASAANLLDELGYRNVDVFDAGDQFGWPERAPYDGIIVGAAAPNVPETLVEQLKVGGRLVIPVGNRDEQRVMVTERTEFGAKEKRLEPVRFVPLIGPGAWSEP